jgi:hypothetical protein
MNVYVFTATEHERWYGSLPGARGRTSSEASV